MDHHLDIGAEPDYQFLEITELSHQAQYSSLLDKNFPVPKGSHFFDDFPIWDPSYKNRNVFQFGVCYQGQIVAGASVRIANARPSGDASLSVAVIGGVVSAPDHRAHGLASRCVKLAVDYAQSKSAAVAILWGSEVSLYNRLGFELCGEQTRVPLSELGLSDIPKIEVKELIGAQLSQSELGDGIFYHFIRNHRLSGFELSEEDQPWFEAHKNVRWFYSIKNNKVTAYCGLGRGIDLPHLVHEWGGDLEDLGSIFQKILELDSSAQLLMSPFHWQDIKKIGKSSDVRVISESLCLAKILDPVAFLKAYYSNCSISLEHGNDGSILHLNGAAYPYQTDRQLIKLILGPKSSELDNWDSLLPVPFWVWGLDAS